MRRFVYFVYFITVILAVAAIGLQPTTTTLASGSSDDPALLRHEFDAEKQQQIAASQQAKRLAAEAAEATKRSTEKRTSRSSKPRPSTTTALRAAPPVAPGSNRAIGQQMAAERGWVGQQWVCLEALWTKESGWNHLASNGSSGAYGIPQALPGTKMATAGADWRTNPATQIRWGLGYISGRYGTPCGAWSHFRSRGWY